MTIHVTKLHQPRPRTDWIARERLWQLLDHALAAGRRLILLSASAGSGKTTLLGHWLAERKLRAAWLSLDPEDDDPVRFWTCVLYAVQSAAPGAGQWALAALQSPAPPPLSSLLPGLFNEIGSQGQPLVIVLDDYHVLTAKGIHDSIANVADHLPEQVCLVICTRADPPLPLARWRARGELAEVRAADLRFTTVEALALLNQRMALNLQPEDAEQLVARTEGWAAGLQLAGLSLQGRADMRQAIRSFAASPHFLLEYLLEEVLARQPAATQQFLLCTSILNRMCGALCDAVTGATGGAATLLDLQRRNLFIIPLDDERCWFRYHHLFAELLRARLQQTGAQQAPALHALASGWYEQNGLSAEAVRHALAAQDWDRAASLLEAHEQEWWTGSDVAMMNLLPHLPDEVVLRGPNLAVYKAWFLLIRGQLQTAAALLDAVQPALAGAPATEDRRGLLSFVAMQQAYIAEISGSAAMPVIEVSSLQFIPEHRGGMRNSAEVILAYVLYREGKFAEAERLLQATIARDRHTGATNGIPIAASRLARLWIAAGRLHDAAALCRHCLAVVEERGQWRFFVAGNLNVVLGDVLREWNRLDEAETCIRAGIAANEPWQVAHANALGYTALARLLLARGDPAGAAAALTRQAELVQGRTLPPDLASETQAVQVRIWLQGGDLHAVAAWAAGWPLAAFDAPDFRSEQDLLALARARLALHPAQQTAKLLAALQANAAQGSRQRRLVEILLLAALAWQAQGEPRRALQAIEQSLALAQPLGCVRVFLDENEPALRLVTLCSQARNLSPQVQAFAQAIMALAAPRAAAGAAPHAPAATPLIEPLTGREQEVLALLAAGCSNQEIAARLIVTLHAVKKHTGNIYGKLGVTSRTQAIVQARKLGLIA